MEQFKRYIGGADIRTRITEARDMVRVECVVVISQSNAGKQIVCLMTVRAKQEQKYLIG